MNNKAQIGQIGLLIGLFITVLVGAILMIDVAQTVGLTTTSVTLGGANSNQTIAPGSLPTLTNSIDLIGQDLLSTPVVTNATGGQVAGAGNYTIGERVSPTTGVKTVYFQLDSAQFSGANLTASGSAGLNITYVYGPDGYINDSAGRSIASLIIILMALGIAVVALTPTLRQRILDIMT